jgi:hypothetical protein
MRDGAVRLLRGRRGRPSWRAPERWVAVAGLLAVLGTLGYIAFLTVTAANVIGSVVLGRPIAWLLIRICSVVTVAAT